jgi:hypothetical protein
MDELSHISVINNSVGYFSKNIFLLQGLKSQLWLKIIVFWDVLPSSLVDAYHAYQHFEGMFSLHHQSSVSLLRLPKILQPSSLVMLLYAMYAYSKHFSTLRMEVTCSAKVFVPVYQTT